MHIMIMLFFRVFRAICLIVEQIYYLFYDMMFVHLSVKRKTALIINVNGKVSSSEEICKYLIKRDVDLIYISSQRYEKTRHILCDYKRYIESSSHITCIDLIPDTYKAYNYDTQSYLVSSIMNALSSMNKTQIDVCVFNNNSARGDITSKMFRAYLQMQMIVYDTIIPIINHESDKKIKIINVVNYASTKEWNQISSQHYHRSMNTILHEYLRKFNTMVPKCSIEREISTIWTDNTDIYTIAAGVGYCIDYDIKDYHTLCVMDRLTILTSGACQEIIKYIYNSVISRWMFGKNLLYRFKLFTYLVRK